MKLDEKAKRAARQWAIEAASENGVPGNEYVDGILTAYIAALPSSPVSDLVDRLERRASTMNGSLVGASDGRTYALGYYNQLAAKDDKEAAFTLTTLSVRNAELEREVKRLRDALKPFSEAADELDERAQDHHDLWEHPVALNITVAHLREAHRALSASPQGADHE